MIPCQTGMNGLVGLLEMPRPVLMMLVSSASVKLGASVVSDGTSGDTPPLPSNP